MSWQFTVGLRVKRKADRIVVDAEDALIAALKVKAERPEATILYVRRRINAATHVTQLTPSRRPLAVDDVRMNSTTEIACDWRVAGGGLIDLHRQ